MKPLHTLATAAGLSALLISGPAMAAASSSATLSNLTIKLIDLDTSDGIAPQITFTDPNYYYYTSYASASAYDYRPSTSEYLSDGTGLYSSTSQPFGAVAASGLAGGASANASVSPGPSDLGPHTLSTSGSAAGATGAGGYSGYSASTSVPGYYYYYYGSFTLTANTVAIFSALATVQASTSVGYDPLNGVSESAYANYSLAVNGNGADGSSSQSSNSSVSLSAGYEYAYTTDPDTGDVTYTYSGQDLSKQLKATVSFTNAQETDAQGYFYAQTSVSGSSSISAVPEASSLALAFAGLGCVLVLQRRKAPLQTV
jgi:hypothetical protein